MALGSGQDLGSPSASPSAGGGRAVALSGFCPMPSGRRCPACHPRDYANRPGKTAAGASRGRGEPHTRPRPRSRSLSSPLPACSAKMAAGRLLVALPLPPRLGACKGSCRCWSRGECVCLLRGKRCKQTIRVEKLLCARNSADPSSGTFF